MEDSHKDNNHHNHSHSHHHDHSHIHESNARWVVIIAFFTMILEICFGYYSNSMALTAEGWHMSSHVFAIGLTWISYLLTRRYAKSEHLSFNREKLLALSGFTSAIVLQIIAVIMIVESIDRLVNPLAIKFNEAIIVAAIGLVVNAISAKVLHHEEEHSDHNIRAAYLHVLADGLTSFTAILALLAGMYFKLYYFDAISGIIGSVVITFWAFSLIRNSGSVLVDFKRNIKQ